MKHLQKTMDTKHSLTCNTYSSQTLKKINKRTDNGTNMPTNTRALTKKPAEIIMILCVYYKYLLIMS